MAETEQLVVQLEARIRDFERNFEKANKTANTRFGAIEQRGRQAADRLNQSFALSASNVNAALSRMGGLLGIGGLLGGATLTAGVGAIKTIAADLAKIGDTADTVGLTRTRLQELRFASEQAAGSAEAVDTGFKLFAQNIAEAATGTGELLKVFEANGVALKDGEGKLRSTNDLLLDFANLVRGARSPADQLRLAMMAFGRSAGPELVGMLRGGSAEIERLAGEANKAGAVIEEQLVRKAEKLDDRFVQVSRTIGTALKSAVVEVADALSDFFNTLNQLRSGETPIEKLGERSVAITREIVGLEKDLTDARATAAGTGLEIDRERVRVIERRIAALQEEDRLLIARGQAEAEKRMKPPAPLPPATVIPSATTTETDTKNKFDGEQAKLAKRIELLAAETATLGLNTAAKEKARATVELLHAAEQAGIPINEELKAKVDELATKWGEAAAKAEDAKDRFKAIENAAQEFGSAVTSAFQAMAFEGKAFNDVLATMLKRLSSKIFEAVLMNLLFGGNGSTLTAGSGFLGSLFSSFGGARADGGPVSPGRTYLVGEKRPELFVPKTAGAILPSTSIGGGQAIQHNTFNVSVTGSAGTEDQNQDLADRIGRQLKDVSDAMVAKGIRQQMKPGGLLYGRR